MRGGAGKAYPFAEVEKDSWANLFDYKGSHEHVRLRFSIDKLGAGLDDVVIVYDDSRDAGAWDGFIGSLKAKSNVPFLMEQTHSPRGAGKRASIERMAFPLPDKPSIAVLPFTNMSDDPKQEYLADGLAEEIINALSRLSSVFVIARNSTFTYKGRNVKIQQVAEEMGVQYVLEGSVRKMGHRVRITAQLVDALTGSSLMSEQYERDLKDVFVIQDDVTMKVLTGLRVNLTEGESARTLARGTKNLEAYLKIVQAYEQRLTYNKENLARAHQLAEEAIALDPGYALAYSYLALSLHNEVNFGVYDNPQEVLERAYSLAEKAVALDDSSAWSHMALGLLSETYKKDWDKAIAEAQRAIAVEPGAAEGYGYLARLYALSPCIGRKEPQHKGLWRIPCITP